ncbi:MAG: hypothetical protein HRU03_00760 [Nanoarchaeales archaeon]|nr:hypothetical protein [Nanoarchaeales archaeon]
MIKKYVDLDMDIKLLDGLVILLVLLLSLALNVYSFPFGIVGMVLFYAFQIVFAFILAVELEEVYFNHKKAHLWVLILVVFGLLFALSFFIGAFGIKGALLLALMIYMLSFRFKKMITRASKKSNIKKNVKKSSKAKK